MLVVFPNKEVLLSKREPVGFYSNKELVGCALKLNRGAALPNSPVEDFVSAAFPKSEDDPLPRPKSPVPVGFVAFPNKPPDGTSPNLAGSTVLSPNKLGPVTAGVLGANKEVVADGSAN